MTIKNLTPHTVNVMDKDNNVILSITPEATSARLTTSRVQVGEINGIPVNTTKFGELTGLPEEEDGVFFITSALIAQAVKGTRNDVLVPDDAVRDAQGRIIGCRAFARI